MPDMKVYYAYVMDLAGTQIPIRTQAASHNPSYTQDDVGGQPYNSFIALDGVSPTIRGTSTAIDVVVNKLGNEGLELSSSVVMYAWVGSQGGTRGTGSTSLKGVIADGLIVPTSIRAAHKPPATIDWLIQSRFDGSNDPMIWTDSIAVPTVSAVVSQFRCGPVVVNGSEWAGIKDITFNYGLQLEVDSDSGNWGPKWVGIKKGIQSLTVRFTNSGYLATVGKVLAISDTTCAYLRKMENEACNVADTTESHIKISVPEGLIGNGEFSVTSPNIADNSVTIHPRKGTNACFSIDTSAAVSV